jgi:hypothetical protein
MDAATTADLIMICRSKDQSLCWFFVWIPRDSLNRLNFVEGVFDLTATPVGKEALCLKPPRMLHAEEDLLWGTNGCDIDAVVEHVEQQWWTPDDLSEIDLTRRLFRMSHAFQKAFNLNFIPCVRRRFKPYDGNVWIVVLMSRLKKQAGAVKARIADAGRAIGTNCVNWTLPACGTFQLVEFKTALQCWSKVRRDMIAQRATDDLAIRGRRLHIGGLHEGVTGAALDSAIVAMGYVVETPSEVISRSWGTVAYVTLGSNDDAVAFILEAEECVVGDPPCAVTVKTARPRDLPGPNYPGDEAIALLDRQDARDKGAAHGMTDAQVATVTLALGQMQDSVLQSTVARLTGAVTGLPAEFQLAVDARLLAIESALTSVGTAVQGNTTAIAEVTHQVALAATQQSVSIAQLLQMVTALTHEMARMATAQENASAYWEDDGWTPNDLYAQGGEPPSGTYFEGQGDKGPDAPVVPQQELLLPRLQPGAKEASSREPRATGGVSLAHVQSAAQLQLAPVVEAAPTTGPELADVSSAVPATAAPGAAPGMTRDADSAEAEPASGMETEAGDSKRAREDTVDEAEDEQAVGKKKPPTDDEEFDLWDASPQLTQDEADANGSLSQLSAESALEAEHIQLRPGYTAFVCGQYIAAWNSMCHAPAQVDNGHTAAMLLQNGLQAEKRLSVISRAKTPAETQGYPPSDALKALSKAHRSFFEERASRDDAACVKTISELPRRVPARSN